MHRGKVRGQAPGEYAALWQLIVDVTGSDYGAAVTRLVLGPLGMTGSWFPAGWPHEDPDAVTGYELEPDGTLVPDLDDLTAILLAAGLWTIAADLVRFGTGWSSLCPPASPARRSGRRTPATSASAGASTWPMALPGRPATAPAGAHPGRQAQRQPRANQPEGAHPGPLSQDPPAGLVVPVHPFLIPAAQYAS